MTWQVSERECRPACASSGRLHANQPWGAPPLPCGGSEAVALFFTQPMLDALAAASRARARSRAKKGRDDATDRCAPMAETCDERPRGGGARGAVRQLYVRGRIAADGDAPSADDEYFVYLGCFEASALERRGLASRPDPRAAARLPRTHADDAALRCSLGCARFSHFAVGAAHLVGGACLCGDLGSVTWARDAEGIGGLHARALRSLT